MIGCFNYLNENVYLRKFSKLKVVPKKITPASANNKDIAEFNCILCVVFVVYFCLGVVSLYS